jgi:hypothetical protein
MEGKPQEEEKPKYPLCRCVNFSMVVCFFCEDTQTEELEGQLEDSKEGTLQAEPTNKVD